jgi:hypothetical protein
VLPRPHYPTGGAVVFWSGFFADTNLIKSSCSAHPEWIDSLSISKYQNLDGEETMPSAIDAPIFLPAQRVSSVPITRPPTLGERTPLLHSSREWCRWLYRLGRPAESAMDRLAREEPYQYIQVSLW